MTSTSQHVNLRALVEADPVLKFLADGGTWADAIELEYSLQVPLWESQLKGAVGRKGPSAERHKARLLKHLQEAYSFMGQPGKAEQRLAQFQREWEEEQAAKGKPKAAPKAAGGAAPKPKAPQGAWAALADSDSE